MLECGLDANLNIKNKQRRPKYLTFLPLRVTALMFPASKTLMVLYRVKVKS